MGNTQTLGCWRWVGCLPAEAPTDYRIPETSKASQNAAIDKMVSQGFMKPIDVNVDFQVFDFSFYEGNPAEVAEKVNAYYSLCMNSCGLMVTTSNFTAWRKAKKTNQSAKVIPAIPVSDTGSENVRVFFFDDNINLHLGGAADVDGICNLRCVDTGKFVDFSVGQNGFESTREYGHTVIHYSSQYRNVLVQANILDAMANLDYFTTILQKFTKPGEKMLVFVDINGTVVWDDTVSGKNAAEVLLSTMFRFTEVRPDAPFEFKWGSQPPVKIDKPTVLRQVVKDLSNKDNEFYQDFWRYETCQDFLKQLTEMSSISWLQHEGNITMQTFFGKYEEYLQTESDGSKGGKATDDGVTNSWLQSYTWLKAGRHSVILNSFGVDTRRVVLHSVPDEKEVLQITVDYDMWGKMDLEAWKAQFGIAVPEPKPASRDRQLERRPSKLKIG